MPQFFTIHPETPQQRLLDKAAGLLRAGAVIAFPTDSCYALGCHLGDKNAVDRMRAIRGIDDRHHLTLMCRDLSEIAQFARVDNTQFRLLKHVTPGPYTFILEGTKELPRRLLHPKRKTIGLRVPDHVIAQALLEALGEPLLTCTFLLPDAEEPLYDAEQVRDQVDEAVDLVLDGGACGVAPTTVVDLTGTVPEVIREGQGSLIPLGLA